MTFVSLLPLLLAAAACLGLNRFVSTRTLGIGAAGATLATALLLVLGHLQGLTVDLPPVNWLGLETLNIFAAGQTDADGLALTLLCGGTLALLAIALVLSPSVKGFSLLFAWALLSLVTTQIAFQSDGLLLPFTWALAVLLNYSAVRASGALDRSTALPQGVIWGLQASLLLLAGLLLGQPALNNGEMPGALAAICVTLACLMLVGGGPFQSALEDSIIAPAALGGLIHGLILPLLALDTFARLVTVVRDVSPTNTLPPSWQTFLLLLGLLTLLIGVAGAMRETHLRRFVAWQASGQAGFVILAIALEGFWARLAVPALLVNLGLTTIAGALAVAALERLTGSDDLTHVEAGTRLRITGLLWALASLSVLGLPPMWGFWGHRWLFEAALAQTPWVIPPILAISLLAFFAYLNPLARFWGQTAWNQKKELPNPISDGHSLAPVFLLATVPLLLLGIWPQLAWRDWLQLVEGAPVTLSVGFLAQASNIGVAFGGFILLLWAFIVRPNWTRFTLTDEDMEAVVLPPTALAASLEPLAWVGYPKKLLHFGWKMLNTLSLWAQTGMNLFEKRFYLAGIVLASVSLILLIARG